MLVLFGTAVIGVTAAVELVAADGIAVVAATDANDLVSQGLCSSFKILILILSAYGFRFFVKSVHAITCTKCTALTLKSHSY